MQEERKSGESEGSEHDETGSHNSDSDVETKGKN